MTIPERIRATYARELAAARDLLSFADDLLEGDWQGRMREKRSDPILWMEVARATKSYRAIILLASEGYGEQAAMVNRSLFEGMAAAHWARAHPDEAHENMRDHQRLSQLLWRERLIRLGWAAEAQVRDVPPADETEWASLQSKFGTYGTRLWTRHRNLDDLVRAIEDQWIEGFERNQLWNYVRVVHQLNNELLHMTGLGLGATVRSTGNGQKTMHLDSGRSDRYVPQAMVAGHWSYAAPRSRYRRVRHPPARRPQQGLRRRSGGVRATPRRSHAGHRSE